MNKILLDIKNELGFKVTEALPISGGFMNELYKLRTDRGELLLKIYSRKRFTDAKLSEVEESLQRQLILEKRGIPTAKIYPISGKAVCILKDGTAYCLMDYINGKNENFDTVNLSQMESLGSVLSLIHRELAQLGSSKKVEMVSVEKLKENYRRRKSLLKIEDPSEYVNAVNAQRGILDRIDEKRIQGLKVQLCHEDFTSDNVLFYENEVAAVIDFDRIRMSTPGHDIGRALLQFALVEGELDKDRISAFMCGYRKHLPISEQDIKDAFLVTWVIETLWWIDQGYFMGNQGKADRFCKEIVFLTKHPEMFL